MSQLRPYSGPEHAPFCLIGGSAVAILVHGFPGTPAEMRPLGEFLHGQGWTVEGILLPGFGPEITELANYRCEDWVTCVAASTTHYLDQGRTVLLIGNSVGAALAIAVAAQSSVAGLVLIAPFWRSHNRLFDLLFPAARPFLSRMRPFAKLDFEDKKSVQSLQRILGPEADLTDPATQAFVRSLPLPVAALAQVRRAGRHAYALAPRVGAPVLVLQGTNDPIAHPHETRALVRRLPRLFNYVELISDHDLVRSRGDNGLHIAASVRHFAEQLLTSQ